MTRAYLIGWPALATRVAVGCGDIGKQAVATRCTYQVQVEIPAVPRGAYPVEVLYQGPASGGPSVASFAPTKLQVTSR
jgi:hypothetical protein